MNGISVTDVTLQRMMGWPACWHLAPDLAVSVYHTLLGDSLRPSWSGRPRRFSARL